MKPTINTLIALLGLLLFAAFAANASASQSAPKPGFPPGTWIGSGYGEAEIALDGDLITLMSTSLTFRLSVSKDGKVTGTGTRTSLQTGSGSVGSKISGVAKVTFSGRATDVRYSGVEVVKTAFVDGAHNTGTTFTRKVKGGLVIKKARSCRVTGGHKVAGAGPSITFGWKASLKGVKCR